VIELAAAVSLVITGDRSFAGVRIGAPAARALTVLGTPDSRKRIGPYECRMTWRAYGLTVRLLDLERKAPCRGAIMTATIASRRWRTTKGIRVGSSVATLQRGFPRARRVTATIPEWRGWWLITRRACVEVGAQPFPGLLARTRGSRITALVLATTACE
jgi:hypothetical protein